MPPKTTAPAIAAAAHPSTGPVTEGSATVDGATPGSGVFYNPVQVVNRDLSILALRSFISMRSREPRRKRRQLQVDLDHGPGETEAEAEGADADGHTDQKLSPITIFEGLSATGLRAIRYAKEVEGVACVTANDLDALAVHTITQNAARNGVPEGLIKPNQGDANYVMQTMAATNAHSDVVDLDPYGTAAPFLDAAVQAVADGGILFITCTDMMVLCGTSPAACFAKYNGMPMKGPACHEFGLRLVLGAAQRAANRYKRVIVPLLSMSIDFYVRLVVRVYVSAEATHKSPADLGMISQCVGCQAQEVMPFGKVKVSQNGKAYTATPGLLNMDSKCEVCGFGKHMCGPCWIGPLHDSTFVMCMLEQIEKAETEESLSLPSIDRGKALIGVISEEIDAPLYYVPSAMCNTVHCSVPPLNALVSAMQAQGFAVSRTHANHLGLKTDMPAQKLWDVLRCWVKANPTKRTLGPVPGSAAAGILSREAETEANFTVLEGSLSVAGRRGKGKGKDAVAGPRFPINPEHWGPGKRARVSVSREGREAEADAEGEASGSVVMPVDKHAKM